MKLHKTYVLSKEICCLQDRQVFFLTQKTNQNGDDLLEYQLEVIRHCSLIVYVCFISLYIGLNVKCSLKNTQPHGSGYAQDAFVVQKPLFYALFFQRTVASEVP